MGGAKWACLFGDEGTLEQVIQEYLVDQHKYHGGPPPPAPVLDNAGAVAWVTANPGIMDPLTNLAFAPRQAAKWNCDVAP